MNHSFIHSIAGLESFGKIAIRYGILIVFLWIGVLKFTIYEADGIVPFVANSPFIMILGVLSFLIATPESRALHLGDPAHGFPYLYSRGRLVFKDIVILGGAVINMSESALLYLSRQQKHSHAF